MYLRESTASQEISLGYFLDSTDGDTEETGLTIANTDIKIRKHGGTTLNNKNSGGATHISNGVYQCTLDATDTNTTGQMEVYVHVSGALAVKSTFTVLTATAFDALTTGTFNNISTTEVNTECDTALTDYDPPTNTELEARTLLAASYFDPALDTVANVTTVATTTTNTDMRGTDSANTTTPPTVDAIADAVLDEVNTVGAHNVVNSLGRQIRGLDISSILHSSSTQAGSTADIVVLASSASNSDEFYKDQLLIIDGEARVILTYTGSSRSATLHRALVNGAPANNTDYEVSTLGPTFATAIGGSYEGNAVHISSSGSLTAIIDRDGLNTNQIDDGQLANARTIADAKNLNEYFLNAGASITLDATHSNWVFSGTGSSVDCGNQDITDSRFQQCTVSGIATGTGAVVYRNCRILAHTTSNLAAFNDCGVVGPITMAGVQTYRLKDCTPLFESGCTFDFGAIGDQDLVMQNWNGGATLQNLGNTGSDKVVISGNGHITLEASCVGGTIEWSGDIKFTNNGSGITFTQGLIGDIVDDTNELQTDDVPALIAALPTASEINAEMVDVLETDTHAEPSSVVGATASIKDSINFIKTMNRNKMTQTATTTLLRNDGDTATISTSTVSDDGTTFIKGKHT